MNIQKVLLITVFALTIFYNGKAQTSQKGDFTVQAGVGILPTYFQDAGSTVLPPFTGAVSYKFLDVLSIGAFAGYSTYESAVIDMYDGSSYKTSTESLLAGGRIAAHARGLEKFDIYGGFQVGYSNPSVSTEIIVASEASGGDLGPGARAKQEFVYSGFIGATGYLTPNFGIYGEIGYGISLFNIGATLKI